MLVCVWVSYQSLQREERSVLLGVMFRLALRAVNHQAIGQLHLTHQKTLQRRSESADHEAGRRRETGGFVTCCLPMKLKSGGAIPKAAQSRASSDALLLPAAALWLEPGVSPWGAVMFAAAVGEDTETGEIRCRAASGKEDGELKPHPVSWTIVSSSAARWRRQKPWLPPAWTHFLFRRRRSSASPSTPASLSGAQGTLGAQETAQISFNCL